MEYQGADIMLVLSHSAVESFYVQASEISYLRQDVQKSIPDLFLPQEVFITYLIAKIIKI